MRTKQIFYCISAISAIVGAQQAYPAYPAWDNSPNVDLSSANATVPNSILAYGTSSGVGYSQNVYFLDGAGQSVYQWSACGGWTTFPIGTVGNLGGYMNCMAIQGHFLYVGGNFTGIATNSVPVTDATNIAKYDLDAAEWSTVGNNNLSEIPWAVAVDVKNNVYVGGWGNCVTNFDPGFCNNALMEYSGGSWVTVGKGMAMGFMSYNDPNDCYEPYVTTLATDGTNIFAAGGFAGAYQSNGNYVPSHGIIKWNGSQWEQMGLNESPIESGYTGIFGLGGPGSTIELGLEPGAICITGTNLFIVGPFNYPNNNLARFSTVNGNSLPCNELTLNGSRPKWNADQSNMSLVAHNGMIYLTGNFDHVGQVAANGIACWINDGTTYGSWSPLGSGLELAGSPGYGQCLAANSNAVFVAGNVPYGAYWLPCFDSAGGMSIPYTPSIARYMTGPDTCLPVLSNDRLVNGNYSFDIRGPVGTTWYVARSVDYQYDTIDSIYTVIGTVVLTNGTATFTDTFTDSYYSGQNKCYYRLQQPPWIGTTSDTIGFQQVTLTADGPDSIQWVTNSFYYPDSSMNDMLPLSFFSGADQSLMLDGGIFVDSDDPTYGDEYGDMCNFGDGWYWWVGGNDWLPVTGITFGLGDSLEFYNSTGYPITFVLHGVPHLP